jgi:hypothetical protein
MIVGTGAMTAGLALAASADVNQQRASASRVAAHAVAFAHFTWRVPLICRPCVGIGEA